PDAKLGDGGLVDFWRQVSFNRIRLDNVQVIGWYSLRPQFTKAAVNAAPQGEAGILCTNEAVRTYGVDISGRNVFVTLNDWTMSEEGTLAGGCTVGCAYITTNPDGWGVQYLAQQFAFAFGLKPGSDTRQHCAYCDRWDATGSGWGYNGSYGYFGSKWPRRSQA